MKKYYVIYFILVVSLTTTIGVYFDSNILTFLITFPFGWFHKEGTNFIKSIHKNTHITFMNLNDPTDWHVNILPGIGFGNLGYGASYNNGFVLNISWLLWILNITYSQKKKL